MSSQDYTKVISKLNRDTKEGKIIWDNLGLRPVSLASDEILIGHVYTSKVLDKYIRLYKVKQRNYIDEDEYNWIESFRLEFIDIFNNAEWAFPNNRATSDLYDTVQFKIVNVEGFMKDFLTDEDEITDF